MTKVESFQVLCREIDTLDLCEHSDMVDCALAIQTIMEWQIANGYHLPAMKRIRRLQKIKANIESRLLGGIVKNPSSYPALNKYFREMRYLPRA